MKHDVTFLFLLSLYLFFENQIDKTNFVIFIIVAPVFCRLIINRRQILTINAVGNKF